ncbi:MAG: hypothetical protein QGG40_10590, partial [Myxococcota bacterium]|nr:hypothetical protein [Myxococcota bacterium]
MRVAGYGLTLGIALVQPQLAIADSPDDVGYRLQVDQVDLRVRDLDFPSGLRVVFRELPGQPLVVVTSVADGGWVSDMGGPAGLSELTAELGRYTRVEGLPAWERVAQLGGSMSTRTGTEWSVTTTTGPASRVVELLRLEVQRLEAGLYGVTDQERAREIAVLEAGVPGRIQSPHQATMPSLHALLFPGEHAYHRRALAMDAASWQVEPEELELFALDVWSPSGTTLVVSGGVHLQDTDAIVEEAFSGLEHLLTDPSDPEAPLRARHIESRRGVMETEPPEPLAPGPAATLGWVEESTLVLGWSLPGGYGMSQSAMELVTLELGHLVQWAMEPDWVYLEDQGPSPCEFRPGLEASVVSCAIPVAGFEDPDTAYRQVAGALPMMWDASVRLDPDIARFHSWNHRASRSTWIAELLASQDGIPRHGQGPDGSARRIH